MDSPMDEGRRHSVSEIAANLSLLPRRVNFQAEWDSECKNQLGSLFDTNRDQKSLFASRIYK
jgi:hypothetical protein